MLALLTCAAAWMPGPAKYLGLECQDLGAEVHQRNAAVLSRAEAGDPPREECCLVKAKAGHLVKAKAGRVRCVVEESIKRAAALGAVRSSG